jgi:hypothetical protein
MPEMPLHRLPTRFDYRVLAYYLARWAVPTALLIMALDGLVLAYWYNSQGDYENAWRHSLMLLGLVIIPLWFWLEKDLFPQAPEESDLSRKAFLTRSGGYFDHPLRFLLWFVGGVILTGLVLSAVWWSARIIYGL